MAMLLQIWFHLIVHSKGVIQQLRGLNFTQLYSLPSLEWTIVDILHDTYPNTYTVNNYMQVTGIGTGENFAFFIYRHFVEILYASAVDFKCITIKTYGSCL